MAYKLAVFDMDGTILDTLQDLAAGVNFALENAGMPTRSIDYVRSIVGNGIMTTLKLCAPEDVTEEQIKTLYGFFAPYYEKHRADNTKPYKGVTELLQRLRESGVRTAVVSNKSDISVKPLCEQYFKGLFDMSLGTSDKTAKKPSPEMPNIIISAFGFDKKDVVYIGDSEVDIATAKNTGIDGIFVDWGFRTRKQLETSGAGIILSNTDDVFKAICSLSAE